MSRKHTLWLVGAALTIFVAAKLVYDATSAAHSIEHINAQELALTQGKCTNPEAVDRRLLQQSWFHDERFTELAGAFGQHGFSLYRKEGETRQPNDGAFCIDGNDLVVRYFEIRHVPVGFEYRSLSDWTMKFGSKLEAVGDDRYTVRELTPTRMILRFASDGREHVFYRKN